MSEVHAPPPGPGMPSIPGPPPASSSPFGPPVLAVKGAGAPPVPPPPIAAVPAATPPPPELANLWGWAKGYIKRFGWALAPVWVPVSASKTARDAGMVGCCCKDGEGCSNWGKHLVSGLGVARHEEDVEQVWPVSDVRVRSGFVGVAMLTGSESQTVVLDVGGHAAMTKARFKVTGHVLSQGTPSGGQHWFFKLPEGEAVTGGRSEIELVTGVWVLGDGAFCVLPPRPGYHWADGSAAAMKAGITDVTDALKMRLVNESLIHSVDEIHPDSPWRTRPGTPLVAGKPRTYTRRGDVRRLVDVHGDKVLFTPGLGWRCWTESGWGAAERSETMIKSLVMELPDVHISEAKDLKKRGEETLYKDAIKWSTKAAHRPTAAIFGDLQTDERVLVPSARDWDAEGWVAGLPVVSGVGRLVNLRTGAVELDARTRRVSKSFGAQHEEGPGGDLKRLWDLGADGGPGRFFVKYISDLVDQYGEEWVRLLQRSAGASLYGRRGVTGDVDAVFVLKGPTRSGKSTFAECLLAVAGQYGKAVGSNLLYGDKGNPEFADAAVYGYRVMTLSEPPMRAELNTTKLKQLSGGDSITGRPPYAREEITFIPEVSLWLLTNHAMEVADEALWRRLKIFVFERSWEEGKGEIPELRHAVTKNPDELRLAFSWMLAGARDWHRSGWGDTETWRETMLVERAKHDPISRWISDCVEISGSSADAFTHGDMMSSFEYWLVMSAEGKPALSKNALRDELEGAVIRAGMRVDPTKRLMVGGRLR